MWGLEFPWAQSQREAARHGLYQIYALALKITTSQLPCFLHQRRPNSYPDWRTESIMKREWDMWQNTIYRKHILPQQSDFTNDEQHNATTQKDFWFNSWMKIQKQRFPDSSTHYLVTVLERAWEPSIHEGGENFMNLLHSSEVRREVRHFLSSKMSTWLIKLANLIIKNQRRGRMWSMKGSNKAQDLTVSSLSVKLENLKHEKHQCRIGWWKDPRSRRTWILDMKHLDIFNGESWS